MGCIYDAWSENFSYETWLKAFELKEYHKISEEFPAFHLIGKRGTLLH